LYFNGIYMDYSDCLIIGWKFIWMYRNKAIKDVMSGRNFLNICNITSHILNNDKAKVEF